MSRHAFDHSSGKSYNLFYSGSEHNNLDNAVKERDGKRYHSGAAHYWIETIDADYCSKEDFISADLLCFNYGIYGNCYLDKWAWFPVTYVYANGYKNYIAILGRQLISKEKLKKALQIFNYDTTEEFKNKCNEVEKDMQEGQFREYRYNSAFESAPILSEYIKASEIGTVR